MINSVEHLLLAICVSSLKKTFIPIFCSFLIFFWCWVVWVVYVFWNINPLSVISFGNISSHSVSYLFILSMARPQVLDHIPLIYQWLSDQAPYQSQTASAKCLLSISAWMSGLLNLPPYLLHLQPSHLSGWDEKAQGVILDSFPSVMSILIKYRQLDLQNISKIQSLLTTTHCYHSNASYHPSLWAISPQQRGIPLKPKSDIVTPCSDPSKVLMTDKAPPNLASISLWAHFFYSHFFIPSALVTLASLLFIFQTLQVYRSPEPVILLSRLKCGYHQIQVWFPLSLP